MKFCSNKINYLIFFLIFANLLKINAEDFSFKKTSNIRNEILIESNNQRSDLINSVFYAEGEVRITNTHKEFIAKSEKAIFYKNTGKLKLIGDVEVITSDSSKIKAGEIVYFVKEKKFEAISNLNERVNTKFSLENKDY